MTSDGSSTNVNSITGIHSLGSSDFGEVEYIELNKGFWAPLRIKRAIEKIDSSPLAMTTIVRYNYNCMIPAVHAKDKFWDDTVVGAMECNITRIEKEVNLLEVAITKVAHPFTYGCPKQENTFLKCHVENGNDLCFYCGASHHMHKLSLAVHEITKNRDNEEAQGMQLYK